jgi:hypothetical protein
VLLGIVYERGCHLIDLGVGPDETHCHVCAVVWCGERRVEAKL